VGDGEVEVAQVVTATHCPGAHHATTSPLVSTSAGTTCASGRDACSWWKAEQEREAGMPLAATTAGVDASQVKARTALATATRLLRPKAAPVRRARQAPPRPAWHDAATSGRARMVGVDVLRFQK
jgi:hypothetical protein